MKRGFTLIELLIVIAIIAILALIAIPNFIEAQTRAKVSRVHADFRSIATALESYFVDYNGYPRAAWGSAHPESQGYFRAFAGAFSDFKGLTTPIGYLSKIQEHTLYDPFMDEDEQVYNRTHWLNNIQGAALHLGTFGPNTPDPWIAGGSLTPPDLAAPAPLKFNGPGGKVTMAYWTLTSAGPDREVETPRLTGGRKAYVRKLLRDQDYYEDFTEGRVGIYDPTNGTISAGNIWRLGGSGSDK